MLLKKECYYGKLMIVFKKKKKIEKSKMPAYFGYSVFAEEGGELYSLDFPLRGG